MQRESKEERAMLGIRHTKQYAARRKALFSVLVALVAIITFGVLAASGTGQAHAQQARQFGLNTVVATTTGLNLRDQPAVNGQVVTSMPANARAIVLGGPFNDAWYWLNYNGFYG